ncbi:hypothetical protein AFGD_011472 [Aspergillus flavus]|nr:hypothetical protein AFGD_011472 [Aspergillus flavus]
MATQLDTHFSPEDITFAAKVTYLNEVSSLILCDPDQMMLLCLEGQYTGLSRGNLPWKQIGDMDQCCPSSVARLDDGFENAKARGIESARVFWLR